MKVYEKVLAACVDAYRNKYPIIFIKTEELELVRAIASSNALVVMMKRTDDEEVNYQPIENQKVFLKYKEGNAQFANLYIEKKLSPDDALPSLKIMHINGKIDAYKEREILEFLDRYTYSEDDNSIVRSSLILMYGNPVYLNNEMSQYCSIIDVPLPETDEIAETVSSKIYEQCGANFDSSIIKNLSYKLRGFTTVQIDKIIDNILSYPEKDGCSAIYDKQIIDMIIRERKKQILKKDAILELKNTDSGLKIGGMDSFIKWFDELSVSIKEAGLLYNDTGTFPPKGVLMCGVPGCGKSMAAKAVATKLNIPLLQMEIGKIMGSLVGESEKNMDKALKLAEAMSPCVLWIDELDKAFSNAGSKKSDGDSGVFKRMFGELLTWMQENTKPCFIFATANDITGMPKEFFRSGRFDALFAVYMPTRNECVEILHNQMLMHSNRVKQTNSKEIFDYECYDNALLYRIIDSLVIEPNCKFVTGADIEKIVNIALRNIWTTVGMNNLITPRIWENALANAINSTSVYGEGIENLDSIAMCYLKLLRKNFRSVSSDVGIVFSNEDYFVEYGNDGSVSNAGFHRNDEYTKGLSDYDINLYNALFERVNRLAKRYEVNNQFGLLG